MCEHRVDGLIVCSTPFSAARHRRIAYLGNCRSGRTNQERLAGYLEELALAGLAAGEGYTYEAPGSDSQHGVAAARHFLALPERPTAVFCFNDTLAVGLLQGFQAAGLLVPRGCSVAGFDNITFSAYTAPPLTTFDQPKRQIGAQATRLLLQQIDPDLPENPAPGAQAQVVRGRLLVRASTAPPAPE